MSTDIGKSDPQKGGIFRKEVVLLDFLIEAVLFFVLGFLFGKKDFSGKERGKEIVPKEEEEIFSLGNSFSVTGKKNPTAFEQWINIMNYCGESQTEEDYEETE
ncbi:MAG: hypothetical protein E7479_00415 [Ruminococcaceae bacterium]|nr:hypothetical protein [Oscillospiraceae bacterium]